MKSKFIALLFTIFLLQSSAGKIFALTQREGCTPKCGHDEVCTALGCISTSVTPDASGNSFFGSIISITIGLGGGLALLLMLYGVFIITTSAGIPDKLKEGKEILTSAISGLIFIILSVFLLRLIGVTILGIPGLK